MLALAEAVDLVEEEEGVAACDLLAGAGLFGCVADIFDAGGDGGECDEFGVECVGVEASDGGFAGAGWSAEDEASALPPCDEGAE